jgi:mgtE-like transporter
MLAGQRLQLGQEQLLSIPLFLISIPVINGVGGNIGTVLGARLASGLHVGYIQPEIGDKNLRENLLTSIIIGFVTYFVLAIVLYYLALLGSLQMGIELTTFLTVIMCTGIILVCIILLISVITAFFSFKRGIDPDDMISPIVTTFGDTVGIMLLFLFIGAL